MTLTHYSKPDKLVEIDHNGSTYDLSSHTARFDIFMEVNAIDTAKILVTDEDCDYFLNKVHGWWDDSGTIKNDTVKIYCNYEEVSNPLTTTDLRFYGFVEDIHPYLSRSGEYLEIECRSYFRCLLDLLIGQEYGTESTNPTLDTLQEILQDNSNGIVDLYLNKLLGSATNSGYSVNDTYIEDIAGTINYLLYPYKPVRDALNDLIDYVQAIKTDTTAGPHWIGVTKENPADTFTHYLAVAQVGNHELAGAPAVEDIWPTYWNSNQADSTIVVKQDMIMQKFDRLRPQANYILYFGNLRKPGSGDAWTEESAGASSLWASGVGNYTSTRTSVGAGGVDGGDPMIGSTCLKLEPNNEPNVGYAFYPSSIDLGWNIENISSLTNIPKLVWYEYQTDLAAFNYLIVLATDDLTHCGGVSNDYFYGNISHALTPIADQWMRFEIPIGPHWANDPALQETGGANFFRWNETGTPDWADINILEFSCGDDNTYDKYIDGLHISGQVIRGAYLSGSPYFKIKPIHDDIAKDDSLLASDDSGTIARLAYAELLRAARRPIQGTIAMPGQPTIKPGQLAHIHAGQYSGGYRINKDMRVLQHHLCLSMGGLHSYLSLSDDVKNANPLGAMDEYNLLQQATKIGYENRNDSSIKAWPVDITHTILEKSYSFSDYF